jgi:hypothetical protein
MVCAAPLRILGQDAGAVPVTEGAGAASTSTTASGGVFGRVPARRRVIPAFWRTHPFDQKFPQLAFTRGVGFQASGWLGGVFLNSYDRLSLIAGIERVWAETTMSGVGLGAGYRAGLLTGYDERLASWADETPILPFAGLLGWIRVGRVSIDGFYVYRAITLESSVVF